MARLIGIIIVLVIPHVLFSQNALLRGTVTSQKSAEPLPGVSVIISETAGTTTDINGNYILSVEPGNYQVTFSFIGFEKQSVSVELTAGEEKNINIQLETEAQLLDIAVISAGKFEQDLGDITVSMEVIKPELIQNKNTTNMQTIMQQTPGVSIVDGEPQIRSGSGYSFGAGSRVQILIDDLPVLSGDAGRPSWGFLPIENLEQVEVIKGASSVLYGSSALSGVINLRTSYPRDTPMTKIQVFQGIYSDPQTEEAIYWDRNPLMSGASFIHSRKVGRLDLSVSGNVLADESYLGPVEGSGSAFSPSNVNRLDGESRIRGNVSLRYRDNTPGLSYGLNTSWLVGESLATLIWQNGTSGLYSAYENSATRTRQTVSTVDPFVEYVTPEGSKHSLRGRWFQLNNNNDNNQDNFSDVYYGQYQFQQNFAKFGIANLKTTFGLVAIHTDSRAELYSGGETNGDNQSNNYAAFLQVDKNFFERFKLSAGVRYEYFEVNKDSEAKPVFRAGLNYQAAKATFVRASFGQGFRFPTIAERFLRTDVGVIRIYPNPDLRAETSYNAEVGVKQGFQIGQFRGYGDFTVFYQRYSNFVEFTFGQWGPNNATTNLFGLGFRSVNTGEAEVRGIDLSLIGEGKIRKVTFQLLAGYTYTVPVMLTPDEDYAPPVDDNFFYSALINSKEVDYISTSSNPSGNILKYRMQHLVRADIQATWKNFTFGVSFRYNSFMQNIDKVFLALDESQPPLLETGISQWREQNDHGDYIFDGRLIYTFNDKHSAGLIVNNVFNREYSIRPLTIESPRQTVLQYTLKF